MSKSKDEWASGIEGDRNNWVTMKCCVCGKPIRVNLVVDRAVASGEEPVYCEDHQPAA
jgi:hypothetical protein